MKLFTRVDLALCLGTHQIIDALAMLLQFLLEEVVSLLEVVLVFLEE